MKEIKVIVKHKGTFENTEQFIKKTESEINEYINNGYIIKTSNMTSDANFAYLYFLLEKDEN